MNYINDYIRCLKNRNYSKLTILSYYNVLFQFYDVFHENYLELEFQEFKEYVLKLEQKGFSNYTLNKHITVLRNFYKFLIKRKVIKQSDVFLLRFYRVYPKLDIINKNDLNFLLNASNYSDDYYSIRDFLIFELLYSTAIRVSELVNIKVSDINIHDCKILVFGKGRKERYVLFGTKCKEVLVKYLDIRKLFLSDYSSVYLLLNKQKSRMTTQSVRYVIDKMSKKLNISKHLYPHLFRHTVASELHERGASTKTIQQILGHSNMETTANYIYVSSDTVKNSYFKYHPRAKMK